MNAWLDTLSSAARSFRPRWAADTRDGWFFPKPDATPLPCENHQDRSIFYWSDVVHCHAPLRQFAPPGTFSFTMLRDPLSRLVSQVTDWRRLTQADVARQDDDVRQCILDAQIYPLAEYLERHGQGMGKMLFDNFLTRAVAASRIGRAVRDVPDARDLLADALRVLHTDYDFIGIAEEFDLSRNALCAMLGLPPGGATPVLNQSRPAGPSLALPPETAHAYTACDRILYNAAHDIFNTRHRALAQQYATPHFEQEHAAALLSSLRGIHHQGATRYSVSEPFYGTGFHGRDGGHGGESAVWSGPQCGMTLYIPVPAFMPLSILLWIRGYADISQREGLKISINGVTVPHRFEPAEGYAELLTADCFPTAPFVRLELTLERTLSTDDLAVPIPPDLRKRGIAFDAYGWRPQHEYGPVVPAPGELG